MTWGSLQRRWLRKTGGEGDSLRAVVQGGQAEIRAIGRVSVVQVTTGRVECHEARSCVLEGRSTVRRSFTSARNPPKDRIYRVRRNGAVYNDEDRTLASRQRALSLLRWNTCIFGVLYYCSGLLVQP